MKIGLYGGTFDPIHKGHILPIREARRTLGLDVVHYLPTAEPPQKTGLVVASATARFAMVELALLWEPGMMVSTYELTKTGPAYSVDTVAHYRQTTDDEVVLLVGSDAFAAFETWRDWQRILEMVEVAVLMRPGWDRARLDTELTGPLAEAAASDRVRFIDNRPIPASSSELRRHLGDGRRPSSIPRLVLDYLSKYELYTSPGDMTSDRTPDSPATHPPGALQERA